MNGQQPLEKKFKALTKKHRLHFFFYVCIFALGIGIGWFFSTVNTTKNLVVTPVHDPDTGYNFINPTLYTETPESLSYPKYTPLKNALEQYVSAAEKSGNASSVGIYYRDLESSDWVGINSTQQFDAASMMKVVTLIALLRASETQPEIMSEKVTIPASVVLPTSGTQDYYPPNNPVASGNSYTIPDLMQRLIVQSDNGADAVLVQYLGSNAMATVYSDLHLPSPGITTGISPQAYSHIFRTLYNATYLSSPDSEKALQLLSQTNFTVGLVAGVPSGTVVAHKFGESLDAPGAPGLNDCGIIYNPGHPYFLCVMTKGSNFNTLAGVIKGISSIAWEQTNALTGSH